MDNFKVVAKQVESANPLEGESVRRNLYRDLVISSIQVESANPLEGESVRRKAYESLNNF